MTKQKMLIGSLSNDLYRVASLTQSGSTKAASRFLIESKKWATELELHQQEFARYIKKIITDLNHNIATNDISEKEAEKLLMYSVLLQNYSIKMN